MHGLLLFTLLHFGSFNRSSRVLLLLGLLFCHEHGRVSAQRNGSRLNGSRCMRSTHNGSKPINALERTHLTKIFEAVSSSYGVGILTSLNFDLRSNKR